MVNTNLAFDFTSINQPNSTTGGFLNYIYPTTNSRSLLIGLPSTGYGMQNGIFSSYGNNDTLGLTTDMTNPFPTNNYTYSLELVFRFSVFNLTASASYFNYLFQMYQTPYNDYYGISLTLNYKYDTNSFSLNIGSAYNSTGSQNNNPNLFNFKINDQQFHHFVFTASAAKNFTLYIDGKSYGSAGSFTTINSQFPGSPIAARICADFSGSKTVAEVKNWRFYAGYELTQADVLENYYGFSPLNSSKMYVKESNTWYNINLRRY